MSTIVRKETMNMDNLSNLQNPKIIKNYIESPKEPDPINPDAVSFAKPSDPEIKDPTIPTESPTTKRQERAAAFKHAADVEKRAQNQLKQAKDKLEQANKINYLLEQAKTDPTAVAKALNMDPTEFLRLYQNKMFDIKDTPPEEDIKSKFDKYEQERIKEKEELFKIQTQSIKDNYVNNKILPVIISNSDKFELISRDDSKTECANFIYDIMDAHFRSTGEELNPIDVAEEMENQLTKEAEERLSAVKKYKKFAKHFSQDTSAKPEEFTIPSQLGENLPIQTPLSQELSSFQRHSSTEARKALRLKKALESIK